MAKVGQYYIRNATRPVIVKIVDISISNIVYCKDISNSFDILKNISVFNLQFRILTKVECSLFIID